MAYLLDTNILLRTIDLQHPLNQDTTQAIETLRSANNLILVTHNVDEFSRVEGLTIEDWEGN